MRENDMKEGSKYQPLLNYLHSGDRSEVTLTFAEIEALMNDQLPASARTKRGWWSNRTKGALQAEAWMEAGYRVEDVDLDEQKVTFRKYIPKIQVQQVRDNIRWNDELIKALRLHTGLTQAEFAEQLGVRQATVSDWEQGIHVPSRAISRYLTLIADRAGFTIEKNS